MKICGSIDITREPVSRLVESVREHSVSRVIFAAQHVHFARIEEAVQACETLGVESWISATFSNDHRSPHFRRLERAVDARLPHHSAGIVVAANQGSARPASEPLCSSLSPLRSGWWP